MKNRIEMLEHRRLLSSALAAGTLTVTGTGFNSGSELRFGKEGINVTNYVSIEEDKIVATISIASNAIPGYRDVYVYNPTGQSARLRSGLFVNR